jgi:2-C-methyl-D-erythritol 2,4-cyclodiphosphate synthase
VSNIRVGIGHDLHRLQKGDHLLLAGISIPSEYGAIGHSDADVVLHAVTDAILGAASLGDIGRLFPDSDPRYKNADSKLFVTEAMRLARNNGFVIGNVDTTISLEKPLLAPYIETMRLELAQILGIPIDRVSIKSKTGEQIGPIGHNRAIACETIILLTEH